MTLIHCNFSLPQHLPSSLSYLALAYSIAKKCVKESSEIPGSPNNVRLLGFEDSSSREKVQVEVSWMKPVMSEKLTLSC